jgi:hypothetical protein
MKRWFDPGVSFSGKPGKMKRQGKRRRRGRQKRVTE